MADKVTPVDGRDRRNDDDALVGQFVDVVDGPHEGRRGAFMHVTSHDKTTGYPREIVVRSRDKFHEYLSVLYKHVRPAKDYVGGR